MAAWSRSSISQRRRATTRAQIFRHVVCDTPLGEAVDAGIVKTPIIGRGDKLKERPDDDAAYRYETHLMLGYDRWKASRDEWAKSGKKTLLFVMTENTEAADQIARRLNTDAAFKDLNGKTINLHTNLKGKIRKRGRGKAAFEEFVESDKDISDEDLKALRKLSRELDTSSSPYSCIVSVLMLREGWDVRNVTTIVPLRPLHGEVADPARADARPGSSPDDALQARLGGRDRDGHRTPVIRLLVRGRAGQGGAARSSLRIRRTSRGRP